MTGPQDPSQQGQSGPKERISPAPGFRGLSLRPGDRNTGGLLRRFGSVEKPKAPESIDIYDPKRPTFTFEEGQSAKLGQIFQNKGVDLKPYTVFRDDPSLRGQVFHRMERTIQISAQELFDLASAQDLLELIGQEVIAHQLINQYLMPQNVEGYSQQRNRQQDQTFEQWEQDVYAARDIAVTQLQTSFAALEYERLVKQVIPDYQLTDDTGSRDRLQLDPIDLEGKAALVGIYNAEVTAALSTGQARTQSASIYQEAGLLDMSPDEFAAAQQGRQVPFDIPDEVDPAVAMLFDAEAAAQTDVAGRLLRAVDRLKNDITSITGSHDRSQILASLTSHAREAVDVVDTAHEVEDQYDPGATQPMKALSKDAPQLAQTPMSLQDALWQALELMKRAGVDVTTVSTAPRLPAIQIPIDQQRTIPSRGLGGFTAGDVEKHLREQGHQGPDSPRRGK